MLQEEYPHVQSTNWEIRSQDKMFEALTRPKKLELVLPVIDVVVSQASLTKYVGSRNLQSTRLQVFIPCRIKSGLILISFFRCVSDEGMRTGSFVIYISSRPWSCRQGITNMWPLLMKNNLNCNSKVKQARFFGNESLQIQIITWFVNFY